MMKQVLILDSNLDVVKWKLLNNDVVVNKFNKMNNMISQSVKNIKGSNDNIHNNTKIRRYVSGFNRYKKSFYFLNPLSYEI